MAETAEPVVPVSEPKTEAVEPVVPVSEPKTEVVEPQNELTKEFTEAEWTALKELRVRSGAADRTVHTDHEVPTQVKLPEISRAVYTPEDKEAQPKAFNLWGIEVDPTNPTKDARVSVVLMKFLRAR